MKKGLMIVLIILTAVSILVGGYIGYDFIKYNNILKEKKESLNSINNQINEINTKIEENTNNYEDFKSNNEEKIKEFEKWQRKANEVEQLY